MKKLITILAIVLLATSSARIIEVADAGVTDKLKAVIAAKNAPAASGAFNLGVDTELANANDFGNDQAGMYRVQASGSGTLGDAYIYYNYASGAKNCIVCVYNAAASGAPDASDTKVGCSSAIASGSTEGFKTAAMDGGSVVSGNYYWIAIFVESGGDAWWAAQGNEVGKSLWYLSGSGYYASQPADASGMSNESPNAGEMSIYVTVE